LKMLAFSIIQNFSRRAGQQSVRWTVCPPRVAPPSGCAAQSARSPQAKRRALLSPPKTRVHQSMGSLFFCCCCGACI
jgi:hypothetical protein